MSTKQDELILRQITRIRKLLLSCEQQECGALSVTSPIWAKTSLDDVTGVMTEIRYPEDLVGYVVGPFESTIPGCSPNKIALLRLDTDWFTSTYHELLHFWPSLVTNGIMIIDDYGHWVDARKAARAA